MKRYFRKLKQYFGRRRNKTFYLTLTSQILIAAQLIAAALGHGELVTAATQHAWLAAVDAVLIVLGTLGVVNDPKSGGFRD